MGSGSPRPALRRPKLVRPGWAASIPQPDDWAPYDTIAFCMVVWNDAERAEKLLEWVRPWFRTLAVAVQESPDNTLEVVRSLADIVVEDKHWGYGDASFGPRLLPMVTHRWTFKVDADEWPDEELLSSLGDAVKAADAKPTKGVWIPFRSFTDGIEWKQFHAHLRLFHTSVGWPGSLHSRPPIEDGIQHTVGHLHHRRSLDEMIRDYLEYYRVGRGNGQWEEHNLLMMREACKGMAAEFGWDYVHKFDWWPEVQGLAFTGEDKGVLPEY